MTFFKRENQQQAHQENNRAFGGGLFNAGPSDAENKMKVKELYKQQLERQMKQKEDRKRKEQELIRKEDEKFLKQIEEINRKENGKKQQQKNRSHNQKDPSPEYTKQRSDNVPKGGLQVSLNYPKFPPIPDLQFRENDAEVFYSKSESRLRPHEYEEINSYNEYYQERIKRHKQSLDQKLDELFHHIHSNDDHIRAEEEVERIRQRLRGKQNFAELDSHASGLFEENTRFYHIPKKQNMDAKLPAKSRVKDLDYQSYSRYSPTSREPVSLKTKVRTYYDEIEPKENDRENDGKWGRKANKDKFLGGRQALDFQIEKTLGGIDDYLNHLKMANN